MKQKDYCTWFPEKWRGVDISECCKIHDVSCRSKIFYNCLKSKIGYHATYILVGGWLGCAVKYPSRMFNRFLNRFK